MRRTRLIINNKEIEEKVKECNKKIRDKTNSKYIKATNYRLKASALEQLKNPSDEIKNEIERCYKEAIKLNPDKEALYLADLSNFYLFSNNIEAAAQNIITINKTKEKLIGDDRSYAIDTITNFKKLSDAKKQIKSELKDDNITPKVANSLLAQLAHLDVTESHEYTLSEHRQLFKIYSAKINYVLKELEINKKHQEVDREQIQALSDQVQIIDDKLKKTGINDKAKFKNQIEGLEKYTYKGVIKPALNESLKDYANSFYWILANKILAYRVLDSGDVKGKVWKNTAAKQLELASNTITKIGSNVCSYVPMYGSTASAVFDSIDMVSSVVLEVVQLYTNAKNKRMVKLVNYELFLGRDKLDINPEELLNQGLLSGAIEIALGKVRYY